MRFRRCVSSLCLLAACSVLAIGCTSAPADNSAVPEAQQWLKDWTNAFQTKNSDAMSALYAQDVVAYDIIPPLQYAGKDAYMKDWKEFFAEFNGPLKTDMKDCHFQTSGNLAALECLTLLSGTTTKGETVNSWLRVTSILRKDNGKWLDIHDHASYPEDPATGKALEDLKP